MRRFLIPLLLCTAQPLCAQNTYNSSGRPIGDGRKGEEEVQGFDKAKLVYGAGATLSFGSFSGSSYFRAGLSPILGYRITEWLSAGVGIGYQYQRASNYFVVPDFYGGPDNVFPLKVNIVTPNVWTRALVWNNFFIQGEFEYALTSFKEYDLNRDPTSSGYLQPTSRRVNLPAPGLLVGIGARQPISDRASFVTTLLYETLHRPYSPYAPNYLDLRFGLNVGF